MLPCVLSCTAVLLLSAGSHPKLLSSTPRPRLGRPIHWSAASPADDPPSRTRLWRRKEGELAQRAAQMSVIHQPLVTSASSRAFGMPLTPIAMIELCANQQVTRYQATLTSIRSTQASYRLSIRDVRLLRSSTPVLQVRDGYIIFNFGDLQGVLQHDRLTIINANRPAVKAIAAEIEKRLKTDRDVRDEAPFEMRALETMLEQTYSVIEEGLGRLNVLVSSTLSELTNSPSSSDGRREAALGRLLPLRIAVNSLQARARRLNTLLEEVLDHDEDMADMCLSLRHKISPINQITKLLSVDDDDEDAWAKAAEREAEEAEKAAEIVETLLDVYDARFQSLGDQIDQVASNIESTQNILELTLDNERNRIARLELLLSMAALCLGVCSVVSGFFGMNLLSGLETVQGLFFFVAGTSILFTGTLFVGFLRRFKSLSRQQRGRLLDVQALKNVLNNLDVVTLLLRGNPTLATKPMKKMKAELAKMLETSGFVQMNELEIKVLCNLLRQQRYEETRTAYGLSVLADAISE